MKVDIFNTGREYDVIYADPPWPYRVWSKKGEGRSAASHYDTVSLKGICDFPVEKLAKKDCVLMMWATYPNLREAFDVLDAWGFTYKTVAFTWVKQNKKTPTLFWGMGYWTRANAEICLLATKGSPKRMSAGVHSVIMSPIQRHSQKPDEARRRIKALMGGVVLT